ncbi:CehA/McbA family metallohydrolase [Gimesia maris]|uniref:CehA/McbA family metallohydrolase n=1 Tax=Gimesia maris TaxID=122 RepID=UPI0032EC88B9
MPTSPFTTLLICLIFAETVTSAEPLIITEQLVHLRHSGDREWATFPEQAQGKELLLRFKAESNSGETALFLRQQDVKQTWNIELNGKIQGKLVRQEQDQQLLIPVPPETLKTGVNELRIYQSGKITPDDIRVGEIVLLTDPASEFLSESQLSIKVTDKETKQGIPCRITIVNAEGTLVVSSAESDEHQAVRTGVVYTRDGKTQVELPAGEYTVYAGRGFEYGVDQQHLILKKGDKKKVELEIGREVDTSGYVSCDTHIHTLTHSGHGDCSLEERLLTLAGEQIEFPIATDHNKQINYEPLAQELKVRQYFTPVIGNEVTTKWGHFNVFPVREEGPIPDYQLPAWDEIFESILTTTDVQAVILNHARDIHSNYRPFGPKNHLSLTGENLDGWRLKANAMELINSGATQTDFMQLYHDWFGMLNRGVFLTPVGCSDSHDVSRYIVGQSRTYIQSDAQDPGKIDPSQTIQNFVDGKVLVSYGLLTQMKVNSRYGPGELVPQAKECTVSLTVSGPSWVNAAQIQLYANGQLIRSEQIKSRECGGVKWQGNWQVKLPSHDCFLVAVATGPGVSAPYWQFAKPYQPASPEFESQVVGSTGAVWIDVDGDGKNTTAFEYAERLVKQHAEDLNTLLKQLDGYDQAVVMQVASLLKARGLEPFDPKLTKALRETSKTVQLGFALYGEAWRASQIARRTN